MQEEWKKVPGAGRYSVSDHGRVRNDETRRIMKQSPSTGRGYLIVGLVKGKTSATIYVHRLVATLFLGNPDNLPQVRHLNGEKTDNRAGNLEWVEHQGYENLRKPAEALYPSGNVVVYETRASLQQALNMRASRLRKAIAAGDRVKGVVLTPVEKVKSNN